MNKQMSTSSCCLALLATALLAAPAFVLTPAPAVGTTQLKSLRGVSMTQADSTEEIGAGRVSNAPLLAAMLGGAGALAVVGHLAGRRGRVAAPRIVLQAEAAEPAEVKPTYKEDVGAMAPFGYFDPLNLCKDETRFRALRVAELKHARVAMMAALGLVTQHSVKFPGFEGVPSGVGAVTSPPGTFGFVALFLLSGFFETVVWKDDATKNPGDFGDPFGAVYGPLRYYDTDMRNRELNNGRAAMFAAIGIIVAELYTGKDGIQQLGV